MIKIQYEEVSVLYPPPNPWIGAILLAPQTPKSSTVQEIVTEADQRTRGKTRLCGELAGLELSKPPQFRVELVELPPQLPVTIVEPRLSELLPQPMEVVEPTELMELVLPYR